MAKKTSPDKMDEDWASRVLCSDESCIGVIGPDGRCKECGLAYDGEWTSVAAGSDAHAEEDADGPPADATVAESASADRKNGDLKEESDLSADDEWARRILCDDEECIGVIGPDGRCKECGRPSGQSG